VLRPHLQSSRPDLLALAGGVYVGIGDEAKGRQLLEQATIADPGDPEPLEALVTLDLQSNNVARARARADQRLQARPGDSRVLVLSARTRGATGDMTGMVELLNRAIQADSTNTTAYALLGQSLAAQGRLKEALHEYERVVERDPRSVPANIMVAMLLEGLGRTGEAEKKYERVLELNPRAAVAANNLAWLIAERGGDLDFALQLAQSAKEGLPEAPHVNDTLAWIFYLKDLPDLALPALRLAIERDPTNPIYHHHAGLAHLKSGDLDSARVSFETALKISPTFNGSTEAKQALGRLR
jgi:tetratricopeptide (TPR) repeat protein